MTNIGGRIYVAGVWQQIAAAAAITSSLTVINTAINCNSLKYDPSGINAGPTIYVWPYGGTPNDLNGDGSNRVAGLADGAMVCARPGDALKLDNTYTGAIFVFCPEPGATFAANVG